MKFKRTKARIAIYNHIFSQATKVWYGPNVGGFVEEEDSFHANLDPERIPKDSLVVLKFAAPSKWAISWLRDIRKLPDNMFTEFLLESVDDGSLMWWSNVSVQMFSPKTVERYPHWRWEDDQFELDRKWKKHMRTKRDAYIYVPNTLQFDGMQVTFSIRQRYGFNKFWVEKTFPNWKKVLMREVLRGKHVFDQGRSRCGRRDCN